MEETARRATADDVAAIADLADAAIEELTPNRGGAVWRRQTARTIPTNQSISDAIDAEDHEVIVGCIDETPVGYGVLRLETQRDGTTLGVIDDLYTDPEARAVGVGEAMMNLVVALAKDHGCFGIDSIALPGDRHTKNFFETFGLVARAIVVHRNIED